MHPGLRTLGDELRETFVRLFAYIGGLVVLAVVAAWVFGPPIIEAAVEFAPRPDWTNVERPYRAFALTVPEFPEPEPDYTLRRHVGGGRKDIMTWGGQNGLGSRLVVEIYRPGKELKHFGEPVEEIMTRAAELGMAFRVKPVETIESKFGPLTLVDFAAKAQGHVRHCLGFARAFADPPLQLAGWYCKAADEVIERSTLSCAVERLSLLAAASEPKVQELFARAELNRKPCTRKAIARGRTLKQADWLSTTKEPRLRGRVAGR